LATCTQTALAATLTVASLLDDGFSNDSNPGAFPIETAVTFSVDSDPTNQATRPQLTSTALATDGDGNTSESGPARSLGEITILDNYEN